MSLRRLQKGELTADIMSVHLSWGQGCYLHPSSSNLEEGTPFPLESFQGRDALVEESKWQVLSHEE